MYLSITDQKNEYIRVEFPLAWKPGINRNNWEMKKETLIDNLIKRIDETSSNLPIVLSNDDIKKSCIVDPQSVVGFIRQFNKDKMIVVCSIKKGEYNIPLEDLQMTFNSIANIDDNRVINELHIVAGIPLLKGYSCYDSKEEDIEND